MAKKSVKGAVVTICATVVNIQTDTILNSSYEKLGQLS